MILAAGLFDQLLQHFPRTEFAALVRRHEAGRNAKGFACWAQLVTMMFYQLAHADSLRGICDGLACSEGKLVHLGVTGAPNKSTLSYANEHRPAALFQDLFRTSLNRFREQQGLGAREGKFRSKNKLLALDSTTISLCAGNRLIDESAAFRGHHDRGHLRRPLGNRAILQSPQTEPEGEEF